MRLKFLTTNTNYQLSYSYNVSDVQKIVLFAHSFTLLKACVCVLLNWLHLIFQLLIRTLRCSETNIKSKMWLFHPNLILYMQTLRFTKWNDKWPYTCQLQTLALLWNTSLTSDFFVWGFISWSNNLIHLSVVIKQINY